MEWAHTDSFNSETPPGILTWEYLTFQTNMLCSLAKTLKGVINWASLPLCRVPPLFPFCYLCVGTTHVSTLLPLFRSKPVFVAELGLALCFLWQLRLRMSVPVHTCLAFFYCAYNRGWVLHPCCWINGTYTQAWSIGNALPAGFNWAKAPELLIMITTSEFMEMR